MPSPFPLCAWSPFFAGSPGQCRCLDLWQCQKSALNEGNAEAAEKTEQRAACTKEEDDLGGGMQHLWECAYVVFFLSMVEEKSYQQRKFHLPRAASSLLLAKNCYFPRKLLFS